MTGALVVTFGIGYFMVASRSLVRHRSIAVLGTIGKLAVRLLAIYVVGGAIPFRLFLIGVGVDLRRLLHPLSPDLRGALTRQRSTGP